MLESSPEAVYSALQRAHKTIDEHLPDQTQQATMRALGDDGIRGIVERFVDAWERSDVDAVATMLTEDATMDMPPLTSWYRGRDQVAAFLREWPLSAKDRFRMIPTRANGQLAFGHYRWHRDAERFLAHGITLLTLRGDRIAEITSFLDAGLIDRFGLPGTYPG